MGLLKHGILPLFALLHGYLAFTIFLDKEAAFRGFGWPALDETPLPSPTLHLMGCLGATEVILSVNCLAGIFLENSHYRGMVLLLEWLFHVMDLLDSKRHGLPAEALWVLVALASVGLLVHANEPGIFTKDKTKTKAS